VGRIRDREAWLAAIAATAVRARCCALHIELKDNGSWRISQVQDMKMRIAAHHLLIGRTLYYS